MKKLLLLVSLFTFNACEKDNEPIIAESVGSSCDGTPTVTYVGKTYNTIQIGKQCWLKENLNVGTMIQGNLNQNNNTSIEKYCYNNDANNCSTYGGLYQWAEAVQYQNGSTNSSNTLPKFTGNVQGICPNGWHIPNGEESQTLRSAVDFNGNALKAIDQGIESGIGTNTSGFSALFAGSRFTNSTFGFLGSSTNFWTSSQNDAFNGNTILLGYNYGNVALSYGSKESGFSVRCLKD